MPRGVPNPKPAAKVEAPSEPVVDGTLVNADDSDSVTKSEPDAVAPTAGAASYVELGEICRKHFPGGWSSPMASKSDAVTCEHDGETLSWHHWVEVRDPE